jgi:predicted dehydrogenase
LTFRILQIGCGARGKMWDEVAHRIAGVEIAGYVDRELGRAQALAAPRGRPAFDDVSGALRAVEADAVVLVTPPFSEQRLTQFDALQRYGRPILAEKPLTLDLASSARIVADLEAAGIPLSISLQFRYLPVSQTYRRLLAERRYGRPGFAQFSYLRNRDGRAPHLNKYPLTMEHPMLLEQTVHHYDLVRFCYDAEPVTLRAHTWNPRWSLYAHDANVDSLIELSNGVTVQYLGTWTGGWNQLVFEWRTDCEGGVITQRELFADLRAAAIDDKALTSVPLEPFTPFLDDTERLLRDFVDCVRGGLPVPCSGRDHLQTLAMVFAAIESNESGARIDMARFRARHAV